MKCKAMSSKKNNRPTETPDDMGEKIKEGIALSYRKLLESKAQEDQSLVFENGDGKIVYVKAKDLLKKKDFRL
jgi:hypothetical protein